MAVHVEFGEVMPAGAPVFARIPRKAEKIGTTTSSAATTMTANGGEYATVTAMDNAVYVTVGSSPTALATGVNMCVIMTGVARTFGPLKDGDKVAVIDV